MMTAIQFIDGDTRDVRSESLGGKGSGLAFLARNGFNVPPSFVITADGFRQALDADFRAEIAMRMTHMMTLVDEDLEEACRQLRELVFTGTSGHSLTANITESFHQLIRQSGDERLSVAVRSSSVAEDGAEQSFAGEHDTYLWVQANDLDEAVRHCWASLFTSRAAAYRKKSQITVDDLAMAVVVQQMVPARSAGVMMTLNPVNGDRSKVSIESVWGLGEPLVSGETDPDHFLVDKITGEIIVRDVVVQGTECVRAQDGAGVIHTKIDPSRANEPSLTDTEVGKLVTAARALEAATGAPQDIEFAVVDAGTAETRVVLLQCRPETVWARRKEQTRLSGSTAMESLISTLTNGSSSVAAQHNSSGKGA